MIAKLIITSGEPSGIGPDLVLELLSKPQKAHIVVVADPAVLQERAKLLGMRVLIEEVDLDDHDRCTHKKGVIHVYPLKCPAKVECGILNVANSLYVLDTLKVASDACLQGKVDAMITPPIHKGIINDAGIAFSGHTEFLAERTGGHHPVMMLATQGLRVALATTHLPLSKVSQAITKETLEQVLTVLNTDLIHRFGINKPTILVCGLNPHAGEEGYLGMEEIEVINPTLAFLRESQGMNLIGALPADTLFHPERLKECDAVLAMYHDQGLPVLKHKGFGNAINVTLGLPIIRTSVDHGTALDLAGKGIASVKSLQLAVKWAEKMVISSQLSIY